jgi:hypothetical protein
MEVDLRAGFVRFYCQVNLEKYNRLALHRQHDNFCLHTNKPCCKPSPLNRKAREVRKGREVFFARWRSFF